MNEQYEIKEVNHAGGYVHNVKFDQNGTTKIIERTRDLTSRDEFGVDSLEYGIRESNSEFYDDLTTVNSERVEEIEYEQGTLVDEFIEDEEALEEFQVDGLDTL